MISLFTHLLLCFLTVNCEQLQKKIDLLFTIQDLTPSRSPIREILENDEGFQLREETESYITNFDAKMVILGLRLFLGHSVARPHFAQRNQ